MLKNKSRKIVVSGSLAYDKIMDFPGRFADHILADKIHQLNISFTLAGLRTSFGGTAGNIAYNLTLLKIKPIILAVVGSDFFSYHKWLKERDSDLSYLGISKDQPTATAHIITDQDDNQIAAFYPGPDFKNYASRAGKIEGIFLAIISPDDKERMLSYAALYRRQRTPFIFDPGQALPAFAGAELARALQGAKILIGNDYEISLILKRLKMTLARLRRQVPIIIITKGAQGSEIYQGAEKILVKPVRPENTSDPTGAGDAYRAGLIAGLARDYDLMTCGQLAATVAAYTVEKFGTQTHRFTRKELAQRYYKNYHEKITL